MPNNRNTKDEEDYAMAALAMRNQGTIINRECTQEFFKKISSTRPTQEFWNECATMRKGINRQFINDMNKLMDKE